MIAEVRKHRDAGLLSGSDGRHGSHDDHVNRPHPSGGHGLHRRALGRRVVPGIQHHELHLHLRSHAARAQGERVRDPTNVGCAVGRQHSQASARCRNQGRGGATEVGGLMVPNHTGRQIGRLWPAVPLHHLRLGMGQGPRAYRRLVALAQDESQIHPNLGKARQGPLAVLRFVYPFPPKRLHLIRQTRLQPQSPLILAVSPSEIPDATGEAESHTQRAGPGFSRCRRGDESSVRPPIGARRPHSVVKPDQAQAGND